MPASSSDESRGPVAAEDRPALEVRLGESGLAWVAGAVIPVGIGFLMAFLFSNGHAILACLTGYAAALALFVLSRVWRRSYEMTSRVMEVAGILLAFYATARLHFFSAAPLIASRTLASGLLLVVTAAMLGWTVWRRSQGRSILCILLGLASGLLVGSFLAGVVVILLLGALAVVLERTRGWLRTALYTVVLTHLAFTSLLFGNPLATHRLQPVSDQPSALAFALALLVVFAWPSLSRRRDSDDPYGSGALQCLNAAGTITLVSLVAAWSLRQAISLTFLVAAAGFLAVAIVQWLRTHGRFAPALFASFGFLAVSVGIYAATRVPDAFPWLAFQSLLVVSTALWFRSRMLVVANSAIFILVLFFYLTSRQPMHMANFGFALVALVSARVMNWKKARLELQTERMRNIYLVIAFLLVPYGLYHAVPRQYVSLSWIAAAAVYFAVGMTLRNVKYRWMAVGTVLLTVLWLAVVDVARLSPAYRIAAFLGLGAVAVGISLFYGRIHNLVRGMPARRE
jgi:hypothetical protein